MFTPQHGRTVLVAGAVAIATGAGFGASLIAQAQPIRTAQVQHAATKMAVKAKAKHSYTRGHTVTVAGELKAAEGRTPRTGRRSAARATAPRDLQAKPDLRGERVVLRRKADRGWKKVDSARVKRNGQFKLRWKPRKAGRYVLKANFEGTDQLQPAADRIHAVRVKRPSPSGAGGSAGGANVSSGMAAELASIRACESGGNYSASTGNGYYGAYQFDLSTWQAAGGTGSPATASPAEQDAVAARWIESGHRAAWPNC